MLSRPTLSTHALKTPSNLYLNLFACNSPSPSTLSTHPHPIAQGTTGDPIRAPETNLCLAVKSKTSIERTDLAAGRRAYQSSVVDQCEAVNAVQPQPNHNISALASPSPGLNPGLSPYPSHHITKAKTRREVDPWWEVSLDQQCHVHSVCFKIGCSKQSDTSVFVFLLKVR